MNSENSKTSDPHRLLLNLSDKLKMIMVQYCFHLLLFYSNMNLIHIDRSTFYPISLLSLSFLFKIKTISLFDTCFVSIEYQSDMFKKQPKTCQKC